MRENFGPVWAPNGREMAAIVDGYLTTYPVARDGTPTGPPRRVSTDLAGSPSWTGDSRRILYQVADRFRLVDLADGSVRDIAPAWSWTPRRTTGTMTVHAGRLFDGRAGSAARAGVDIVIDGNRITAVDAASRRSAPRHRRRRVGRHRRARADREPRAPVQGVRRSAGAHLAVVRHHLGAQPGDQRIRRPGGPRGDRCRACASGRASSPPASRSTAPASTTRAAWRSTAAPASTRCSSARPRLRFDFIKTYVRLPDLLQKRVIEARHRAGMPVTSHEIYPAVAYGADGVEHIRGTSRRGFSPKMSELRRSYQDVIQLLTASGMTITPTIGIQGGNQLLTLQDGAWLDDPRMKLFPPSVTAGRGAPCAPSRRRRRTWRRARRWSRRRSGWRPRW